MNVLRDVPTAFIADIPISALGEGAGGECGGRAPSQVQAKHGSLDVTIVTRRRSGGLPLNGRTWPPAGLGSATIRGRVIQ
jgi:hypothetical protein